MSEPPITGDEKAVAESSTKTPYCWPWGIWEYIGAVGMIILLAGLVLPMVAPHWTQWLLFVGFFILLTANAWLGVS